MSLTKDDSDIYYLRESVEFFHPYQHKKFIRVSTGCRNLKDTIDSNGLVVLGAKTWRSRYLKELQERDMDRKGKAVKVYLYDGFQSFIESDSSQRLEKAEDHHTILRRIMGKMKKHKRLKNCLTEELTYDDIVALRTARLEAGFANSTWNKELYFISGALAWLAETKYCYVEPMRWKKLRLEPFAKMRWASMDVLQQVYDDIITLEDDPSYQGPSPSNGSMIYKDAALLLMRTGARSGEIKSLRWEHFKDNEGTITIRRTKVRKSKKHEWITLELPNDAHEMLRRRMRNRRTDVSRDGRTWESPYIFPSPTRRGIPINNFRHIAMAIDRAGLNDDPDIIRQSGRFTVHSLRDSYASFLVQRGTPLLEVQELLGHSSATMTQKYAHLIPSQAGRNAANLFNNA